MSSRLCGGPCEGWGSPTFPRRAVDKWLLLLPLLTPTECIPGAYPLLPSRPHPPAFGGQTPEASWPSSGWKKKQDRRLSRGRWETTDVPASRQKGPTQEGGPLNPAPTLPSLPWHNTVKTKARIPKPWHIRRWTEASGACSQLGASPLGIPGCPAHSERWPASFTAMLETQENAALT